MFGRGSMIVAAGFAMVIGGYSLKMNRMAVNASDNFNALWQKSLVHEEAMSGMNFGINRVWGGHPEEYSTNLINTPCTTAVNIIPVGTDTVIVRSIARGYLRDDQYWEDNDQLLHVADTVMAYFTFNIPVSEWFYFTNNDMGIYWTTGDTVWGPMHCNRSIVTSGAPVFYEKVTARLGISPLPGASGNQARYYGGWEIGVNASIPTDLSRIRDLANEANAGHARNTCCVYDTTLTLKFRDDGTVIRKVGNRVADTVQVTTIAPTGVLYVTKDIHISGVLNGSLTMLTDDDVWIDDNITYAQDPLTVANADDYLGMVAIDDIFVTENVANNSDVTINASMLAVNGSFTAQNYSTRVISGVLRVVGSIAQNTRGAVGTFNNFTHQINHGFSKRYYFDPRLRTTSPPNFPFVRSLRLSSWWE